MYKKGMKSTAIILFLFSLFLSSCSYKVGNLNRSLPGKHKFIAVPTFKNQSNDPGAESYFTNALLEEMLRADFLKVVRQERAELVLEGSILKIDHEPEGTVDSDEKSELPDNTILNLNYNTRAIVELRLRRTSDQKVIWSSVFSGNRTTPAAQIGDSALNSSNTVYDYSAKNYSLRVISRELMQQAFTRMTEDF